MIRTEVRLLRLGPALLTALLLGVPRALGGRAFGDRAVYVEVAAGEPELTAFGEALSRVVARHAHRLIGPPRGPATVITVHRLFRSPEHDVEAVSVSVGDRRLVLHYPPGARDDAALTLLESLGPRGH